MLDLPDRVQISLAARYRAGARGRPRGGMATVYLAHDVKHGRLVALKTMRLGPP